MINLDKGQMIKGNNLLVYLFAKGKLKEGSAFILNDLIEVVTKNLSPLDFFDTVRKEKGEIKVKNYYINCGKLEKMHDYIVPKSNLSFIEYEKKYNEAIKQK